jgi:hypothetical protein
MLMPLDAFRASAGDNYSLTRLEELAAVFGSSLEATTFRLATAHPGVAVAGLLRYRRRKDEERQAQVGNLQRALFKQHTSKQANATPKYRRQSCYLSESCGDEFMIRWNKSFDPHSIVYKATAAAAVHASFETLPNNSDLTGRIEAIRDPFQREEAHPQFGDVLFFWTAVW